MPSFYLNSILILSYSMGALKAKYLAVVKRLFYYLKETKNMGLVFFKDLYLLIGYSNAN